LHDIFFNISLQFLHYLPQRVAYREDVVNGIKCRC